MCYPKNKAKKPCYLIDATQAKQKVFNIHDSKDLQSLATSYKQLGLSGILANLANNFGVTIQFLHDASIQLSENEPISDAMIATITNNEEHYFEKIDALCSISMQVMSNPVCIVNENGVVEKQIIDEASLLLWMKDKGDPTSPFTRVPISKKTPYIPADYKKNQIINLIRFLKGDIKSEARVSKEIIDRLRQLREVATKQNIAKLEKNGVIKPAAEKAKTVFKIVELDSNGNELSPPLAAVLYPAAAVASTSTVSAPHPQAATSDNPPPSVLSDYSL